MIRPYEQRDHEVVLALADRLRIGVAAWCDLSAVEAATRAWLEQSLAAGGDSAVFVAEQAGVVVGVVSVSERRHWSGARQAYVGELAVGARATRTGIGTALMRAAEQSARERGLTRLSLETGAGNAEALAFYRSLGYVDEEVRLSRAIG